MSQFWLGLHLGERWIGERELHPGMMIIGRRAGCGWVVDDFGVEPQHVRLDFRAGGVCTVWSVGKGILEYHGTQSKQVTARVGDEVKVGVLTLRFTGQAVTAVPQESICSENPAPSSEPLASGVVHETPVAQAPRLAVTRDRTAVGTGLWSGLSNAEIVALLDERDAFMPLLDKRLEQSRGNVEDHEAHRQMVRTQIKALLAANPSHRKVNQQALIQLLEYEVLELGVISGFDGDESVTEIMVNSESCVYIEREGRLQRTPLRFRSREHLRTVIERIVTPLNKRIDDASPRVDARLVDGSRVNAVIPPLAVDGPCVTIRRFRKQFGLEQLLAHGAMSRAEARFLEACVVNRLNVIVSGGTGSGKTTLLNALSSFIPTHERIVTIEDIAELQWPEGRHKVRLESRPPSIEGAGEVPIRDLVINALRMRPDRIVVGECRGREALDMMQAMNTGHDGSLTTLHANTPHDALRRLETLCLMAQDAPPVEAIRDLIGSAIHIIVQVQRFTRDGTRRIVAIEEISGLQGSVIGLTPVFKFEQMGSDPSTGRVLGVHKASRLPLKCFEVWRENGVKIDPSILED